MTAVQPTASPEMSPEQLMEAADGAVGSILLIRSMARELADKADYAYERQLQIARGVTTLRSRIAPRAAGSVSVAVLCVLAFLGVITMGAKTAGEKQAVTHADTELITAQAALRSQDYQHAIHHFESARKAGCDPGLALMGLAECCYQLGEYDLSLMYCDQLNKVVPNCGFAHHVRGLVYLKQGKQQQAEGEFRTAVRHGFNLSLTLLPKAGQS